MKRAGCLGLAGAELSVKVQADWLAQTLIKSYAMPSLYLCICCCDHFSQVINMPGHYVLPPKSTDNTWAFSSAKVRCAHSLFFVSPQPGGHAEMRVSGGRNASYLTIDGLQFLICIPLLAVPRASSNGPL